MKRLPVFFFSTAILLFSCNDSNKYEVKAKDKYESTKEELSVTEQKNPERFIKVSGSDKRNLLGQTVIKGTLFNSAKIVSFKDIDLKLSFYSKTGALLEEDHEVVYETVEPGGSKSFKTKYFAPKGTDSVAMKVISAKY